MTSDRFQQLRLLEAALFASSDALSSRDLQRLLPEGADVRGLLSELQALYTNRGVVLERSEDRWAFRTAWDLAPLLQRERVNRRKLSRAATDVLAIIAYHQPVTRAEIEEVRGVALSRGTLDALLEAGWVQPKGRRQTPGRPLTWGTTAAFLDHFGLESLKDLPGIEELKAAGLLDSRPAVTALGERGLLPPANEASGGEEQLDEDFGENLWPEDQEKEEE
ncbi:MAG TPA: SMC-Scp complex subunit ScpB [Kiloniellales bacterium]|jgi:segregation and condensation protein B|nr:SMC-Scp complex subunit ScpB [Kiloniellales bacterium]